MCLIQALHSRRASLEISISASREKKRVAPSLPQGPPDFDFANLALHLQDRRDFLSLQQNDRPILGNQIPASLYQSALKCAVVYHCPTEQTAENLLMPLRSIITILQALSPPSCNQRGLAEC
ncbi:MAG: hypothetical protein K0S58_489 [Nitrospira sp.]|jgi:hypothetical protein|nr:hypothetical protein [Nitrospira sp.]